MLSTASIFPSLRRGFGAGVPDALSAPACQSEKR